MELGSTIFFLFAVLIVFSSGRLGSYPNDEFRNKQKLNKNSVNKNINQYEVNNYLCDGLIETTYTHYFSSSDSMLADRGRLWNIFSTYHNLHVVPKW